MQKDFTLRITASQPPEDVYRAINDVRSWWSGTVTGAADAVGSEFTYRYGDLHVSRQRVVALDPGRRIAWRVEDATLSFVDAKSEWNGTQIVFDIARKGDQTEVVFTHVGLRSDLECFESCAGGWRALVLENLRNRIVTGKPQPDAFAE